MEEQSQRAIREALRAVSFLKLNSPFAVGSFEGGRTGVRSGGAMEFADYRPYRAGDELRRIDWQLYARSEQLNVRRYALETDPRCDILIDCTSSMNVYQKSAAAAGVGAIFAQSALNGGFSLQVWTLGDELNKVENPGEPLLWNLPPSHSAQDVSELLFRSEKGFFRNGLRIFISDLLFETPPETVLKSLGGAGCVIVQILGEAELEPVLSGEITLHDPESGRTRSLTVDERSLQRYKEKLHRFQARWAETARKYNSCIFFLNASVLLKNWDMETFCREGVLQ